MQKTARVLAALNHQESDRVPVGEFFWTNFIRRCKSELDVGDDFDPYRYWDLDMIVISPNMDPHITGIEVLEDDRRAEGGTDRVRGDDRAVEHSSHAAFRAFRHRDPSSRWRRSSSTTRRTRGGTTKPSTTRSTAWPTS